MLKNTTKLPRHKYAITGGSNCHPIIISTERVKKVSLSHNAIEMTNIKGHEIYAHAYNKIVKNA